MIQAITVMLKEIYNLLNEKSNRTTSCMLINCFLMSFLFISPLLKAQDINFIGSSQKQIEKLLIAQKKSFKNKKGKLVYLFNYDLKSVKGSDGNTITYYEKNFINYSTPYYNLTSKYFINKSGYCDSIRIYENVCTDCSIYEDSIQMILYSTYSWQILSKNEFRSNFCFMLSNGISKWSEKQCAFVHLVRETRRANDLCRIYTLTLEEPLEAIKFKNKNLYIKRYPKSVFRIAIESVLAIALTAGAIYFLNE